MFLTVFGGNRQNKTQGIFKKFTAAFDIGQGDQKFYSLPYSISFLNVLHQNKALYDFCKRGQCLIVERITGLEYALKP